jgi:hypothetical protein
VAPLPVYKVIADVAGVSAGFIYALAQVPVLLAGLRLVPQLASSRLMRVLGLSVGLGAVSLAWSAVDVMPYGVEALMGLLVMLAWTVIVAADPETMHRLANVGFVIVMISLPIAIVNLSSSRSVHIPYAVTYPFLAHPVGAYGDWIAWYPVIAVALYSRMFWDMSRKKEIGVPTVLYALSCVALLVASSYRAVTLGATLGLAYVTLTGKGMVRRIGIALTIAVVIGIPLLLTRHETRSSVPSSTDIAARYESIGSDRLDGRIAIWDATLQRLRHDPTTLLIGTGLASAPRYVTDANLSLIAGIPGAAQTVINSHNTLLEMLLTMGVAGLTLGVVITVMVIQRLISLRDPVRWALWVTIGFVAMANLPAYDYFKGDVIMLGLGFGVLLSRKGAAPPEQR